MARAPYLTRRDGGRYYLQIRLGKVARALYGRQFLRASLRTSDYAEARKRLVDNLGWACEIIDAPDLEALGTVLDARLTAYASQGAPTTERVLAERVAFEHQVRSFTTRANERGYLFGRRFKGFASRWVEFVDQNKFAEQNLLWIGQRREYERGRADASEAAINGWSAINIVAPSACPTLAPSANRVRELPADVQGVFGIQSAPSDREASTPTAQGAPSPAAPNAASAPPSPHLSEVLQAFYADKKKHKKDDRARGEYGPIMSFLVALLGDPEIGAINVDHFKKLDEALPEIPDRKGMPQGARGSLIDRYNYAQKHGWDSLKRLTETTIRNYHVLIGAFFRWAKRKGYYHGPLPVLENISEENLAALPRDAFEDDELLALVKLPLFTGCQGLAGSWNPKPDDRIPVLRILTVRQQIGLRIAGRRSHAPHSFVDPVFWQA